MSLSTLIATEFPIAAEAVYLNHAASAPLPTRSATTLHRYADDRQRLYHLYQAGAQDYDPTPLKGKLGRLINCPSSLIGFVPSTMDGVSGSLNGLAWRPGDNVVLAANEFPGVVYACLNLRARGVDVRQVAVPSGHVEPSDLMAATDARTRAVVASHVHWQTGYQLDIDRLGRHCSERDVVFILDAIQSLGAVPIDMTASKVDVLVAGTYKWLLATQGLAVMAMSPRALARVTPDRAGWTSMEANPFQASEFRWADGARRFSVGGSADPALMALETSVDLILELGVDYIAEHTQAIIDRIVAGLMPLGLAVNSRLAPGCRSAIVSVTTGDRAIDRRLTASLVADRIVVAERGPGIRISPHVHTTPDAVDRLVMTTKAVLRR